MSGHLVSEMEETIENLSRRLDAQDIELDALRGKEPHLKGYQAFRELVKAARAVFDEYGKPRAWGESVPPDHCRECGYNGRLLSQLLDALKPFED